MADRPITIIRIRRGINGFPYAACADAGYFIRNISRLGDARKHWQQEIKWGQVKLIRELDKRPDMAKHNAALRAIDTILTSYKKKRRA